MLIALFASINSSQPDNWRSVFYSGKEIFVTLFEILDTGTCARSVSLRTSQLNRKQSKKPFLLSFLHDFSWERLTYPRLLTAGKNWVHYFCTSDKMAISEMVPSSISHRMKKDFRSSVSADVVKITVIWYCEEVIIVNEMSSWEKVNSAA